MVLLILLLTLLLILLISCCTLCFPAQVNLVKGNYWYLTYSELLLSLITVAGTVMEFNQFDIAPYSQ